MSTYDFIAQTSPGQLGVAHGTIPEPAEDQVVIKAEYSVLGPADLGALDLQFHVNEYPFAFGLSAAGTIHKVGAGVTHVKAGDRVTAITPPTTGSTGLKPYVIQRAISVAKIPDSLPFEKAVAYPDNLVTAFYTLFNQLGLPEPSEWPVKGNSNAKLPIFIYGAGATSGQYALQLLKFAGYTNVVAAASLKHEEYLKSLGASHVADYKNPTFAEDVIKAAGGKVELVMDCISLPSTFGLTKQVIKPGGKVAFLAPFKNSESMQGEKGQIVFDAPKEVTDGFPEGVSFISVKTFFYQQDEHLAKTLMPITLPKLIDVGVQPNRTRVLDHPDPLTRVTEAFELLRQNKVSGEKLVVKIGA